MPDASAERSLPPPIPRRPNPLTILLSDDALAWLKERASERGEPHGRLASLIVEQAVSAHRAEPAA